MSLNIYVRHFLVGADPEFPVLSRLGGGGGGAVVPVIFKN